MVKLHFTNMTTINTGIQLPGSTAIVADDYGKELVRLSGVSYVEAEAEAEAEAPKKKAKAPKKPKASKKSED